MLSLVVLVFGYTAYLSKAVVSGKSPFSFSSSRSYEAAGITTFFFRRKQQDEMVHNTEKENKIKTME